MLTSSSSLLCLKLLIRPRWLLPQAHRLQLGPLYSSGHLLPCVHLSFQMLDAVSSWKFITNARGQERSATIKDHLHRQPQSVASVLPPSPSRRCGPSSPGLASLPLRMTKAPMIQPRQPRDTRRQQFAPLPTHLSPPLLSWPDHHLWSHRVRPRTWHNNVLDDDPSHARNTAWWHLLRHPHLRRSTKWIMERHKAAQNSTQTYRLQQHS